MSSSVYTYQKQIDGLFGEHTPATQAKLRRQALNSIRYLVEQNIAPEFNLVLAICYLHGMGIDKDERKALEYFEKLPGDFKADPSYLKLQAAIREKNTVSDAPIYHHHFYPPVVSSDTVLVPDFDDEEAAREDKYEKDLATLTSLYQQSQTVRGRFFQSLNQGHFFEDVVSFTNWGHELRRPTSNYAGLASAAKFAPEFTNFMNNISFIGLIYYLYRFGMLSAAVVQGLWRTRDRVKSVGDIWPWVRDIFNKNGRVHTLLNDALWGGIGLATLFIAGPAAFIVVAVGLSLDILHQAWIVTRAVIGINRRIQELTSFKADQQAVLNDPNSTAEQRALAELNIGKVEIGIDKLKHERTVMIVKTAVITGVLLSAMFAGFMVTMAFPIAGAGVMFVASVGLLACFLVPKLIDAFVAKKAEARALSDAEKLAALTAKHERKSENAYDADLEEDVEQDHAPVSQKQLLSDILIKESQAMNETKHEPTIESTGPASKRIK